MAKKQRSDGERRTRQCARIARVLRILRLVLGPGRWDPALLAAEVECSPRTVHRDMMTLGMTGVPWRYDQELQSYRIQAGFKFPAIEVRKGPKPDLPMAKLAKAKAAARKALAGVEQLNEALRDLFAALDDLDSQLNAEGASRKV